MSWVFNGVLLKVDKFVVEGNDYMLLKAAERMFYPSSGSGAFSKMLTKQKLGKATPVSMKQLPDGVDMAAYDEMHAAMAKLQRALEPTQPRIASSFSIVKLETMEALCKVPSAVHPLSLRIRVLETLGLTVPEMMAKEREHAKDEGEGFVNLLLDDELDAMHELEATLQQELEEYERYKPSDEDDAKVEPYKLAPVPRHLVVQLKDFEEFQTKALECRREGAAVAAVTASSDVATYLRFAGWRQSIEQEPMACMSMFLSVTGVEVQRFTSFLTDTRGVSYGTVANYLNSLLNVMSYVSANAQSLASMHAAGFEEASFDVLIKLTKNLRQQAESQAKQEKMYKHRKADWISWSEAKATRDHVMEKLSALPNTTSRKKKLVLLTDALIINLFTVMPPDRCSVIRLLSVEHTLKQEANGNYYIDLQSFKHKTAKFYGPSMTPISPLVTPLLKRFLGETQSNFEFTERGVDEELSRTSRRYLFALEKEATQPLSSTHWCTRVEAAFRRHTPSGQAPCPTLLRSPFITALRSSNADLSTLQSAAIAQKHSIEMQSSDVYDLDTHRRATSKAMQWCHDFAAGVAGVEVPMALPAEALQAAPAEAPQAEPHAGAALQLVPQPGVGGHGKKRPADEAWVVQTHGEFFY